jgi:hypothetical protein
LFYLHRRVCPGDASIQPNDIPRLYVDITPPATDENGGPIEMTSVDHGNPLEIQP